jgi:hypothetical protein
MEGVDVPLIDFPGREEMIRRVQYLLNYSIHTEFHPPASTRRDDTLAITYELSNSLTGHNVPSGPAFNRQMWVEIIVQGDKGDTVYASGLLDGNGDLRDNNSDEVKRGLVPKDNDLNLYNAILYRHGVEGASFINADAQITKTIPPAGVRYATYFITPAMKAANTNLNVRMRLLFRAIPPYTMRAIGLEHLLDRLLVFTMEESSAEIIVE